MYWTIMLIALKFIAFFLVLYAIAEFLVWKALRDYESEKRRKPANMPLAGMYKDRRGARGSIETYCC